MHHPSERHIQHENQTLPYHQAPVAAPIVAALPSEKAAENPPGSMRGLGNVPAYIDYALCGARLLTNRPWSARTARPNVCGNWSTLASYCPMQVFGR